MSVKNDSGVENSLAAALRAAESSPESDDAWDHLESLAESQQQPDEVAALYRDTLRRNLPEGVRTHLAERAVRFHEEWYGDQPAAITDLLIQILERDPNARWALDRLTVALTAREDWDALLEVYDRVLINIRNDDLRREVLAEAAHVAKEFADKPELAADYLLKQVAIDPDNQKLAATVERLLERLGRWSDLVGLWEGQVDKLPASEARDLKVRIAAAYLERLDEPVHALVGLTAVLDEVPGYASALAVLEALMSHETAPIDLRGKAFALLRQAYVSAERHDDVIRLIKAALDFAEGDEQRALYRDLGNILAMRGQDADALGAYRQLLRLTPSDSDARKQIRQLASRSGRHDLHSAALLAAAQATEGGMRLALLLDAAQIKREALGDIGGALTLYREILDSPEVEPSTASIAAHSLASLLTAPHQRAERLLVLERLASLEKAPAIRQAILGEAANLAEDLGKRERALGIWQSRLEADPGDVTAMSAVIRLLESLSRWEELAAALLRRAEAPVIKLQQRADLLKAAELQAFRLGNIDGAIDILLGVRESFGEDPEVLGALDRQLTACARFGELATLLERSASTSATHTGWLYVRAAEIHLRDLEDKAKAAQLYAEALSLDPRRKEALNGLREVLSEETCREIAVRALLDAYRRTDEWGGVLDLVEHRLELAPDDHTRARILGEAAHLAETRGEDPVGAREMLARALVLDPGDVTREHELTRLAAATNAWQDLAAVLASAAERAADAPARSAQLYFARGKVLADELRDAGEASAAFAKAAGLEPQRLDFQEATARHAARASRWPVAAEAVVKALRGHESHDAGLLAEIATAAKDANAWRDLADATQMAADAFGERLTPTSARHLELTIADWYDHAGADEAAIAATQKASIRDPNDLEVLRNLAHRLRSRSPGERIDTLLRIDAIAISDLDALREAAAMAFAGDDDEVTRNTLYRLYRKAARMWSRGEEATGVIQPEGAAIWALEEVCKRSSPELAARLLLDGATLPVTPDKSRELRRQAAELLAGVGQRARAIDLYFGILSEGAEHLSDILRVAGLCEEEGRTAELLELRTRELAHTDESDRRLELRLEIARLAGELETRDSRIAALRANLSERPGHAETLETLQAILSERGRYAELAEVLEDQARQLAAHGQPGAADLWLRVAQLAEDALGEPSRAVAAYRAVVEIAPSHAAIEALARLHLQRDEPGEAALWLQRRLDGAAANERVAILLKLARAQIAAERQDDAIKSLQTAFNEAPRNGEVRKLLLGLLRAQQNTMALADTLATAARHITDASTVLNYAREAATLYQEKIGAPELAVPVLERALEIAPDDRSLKVMLAKGLLSSGRLPEAKSLLAELIEGFGRRRSPERAQIHLLLAQVLHAEGEIAPAIDQLEAASSMDPGNIAILRTLAELARQSGQLARAERAYRTLLVNLRRAGEGEAAEIGPAEVLLKLSRIAKERGQDDKATELVESASDALAESDAEAPRLQADLRERRDFALLRRVIEARLGHVEQARQRADILGELAEVYERDLGQPEDALEARLRALEADPGSPARHEAARDLAVRIGLIDRYAQQVEALLELARRPSDAHARCELLLRLGEVMEKERGDLERAADLYRQAEGTGVRQIDAWRAGARVAAARGDNETQVHLLGLLSRLGAGEDESRVDALYRVAEIQLANPETQNEGLDALLKALADEPRYGRAGLILQQASEHGTPSPRLLELFEQVARRSGDDDLVLAVIERRVARPEATPDEAREGAELALRLEAWDRAEALFQRALALAHGQPLAWALLALAQRRKEAGDLAGAVRWLGEAAEHAELAELLPIAGEIVHLALGEGGDPSLAAKLYERLLERDSSERAIWEPLMVLYRRLGAVDRLEQMVTEIIDGIQSGDERNLLRRALAAELIGREDRNAEVIGLLKAVLADNPEDQEARALLSRQLESAGDSEALAGLLRDQLTAAQKAGDRDAIRMLTIKIANGIRRSQPEEALALAHAALAELPEDPDLLALVLDLGATELTPGERGALMERLLSLSEGATAVKTARDLFELRRANGDDDGARRALEIGLQRSDNDGELFSLLEAHLRDSGQVEALAALLQESAKALDEAGDRSRLLREAALLLRDNQGDPAAAALLLMDASSADPSDPAIKLELATTLSMAGDLQAALETIAAGLKNSPDLAQHVAFLRCRAGIYGRVGELDAALADLDEAYTIDPDVVAEELVQTVHAAMLAASKNEDMEAERTHTLRLVDLLLAHGQPEQARELLAAWVSRASADTDAMTRLWRLDAERGDWESVVNICSKLVIMATGELQAEAGLALADASVHLDRSQAARFGLEYVRSKQPDNRAVREKLQHLYEQLGAVRELAGLLIEDASSQENPTLRLQMLRRVSDMLLDHGDRITLLPVLTEIVNLDPADRESALTLAGVHLQAGNLDQAEAMVDQIIAGMGSRKSPELGQMFYRKALIARAKGDRDSELNHLQEALVNDKDNGLLAAELAELAEVLENWDVAMRVLRTITMMENGECPITKAQAYARQARIAHRTGDSKRAIFWARRATQEDPELEEAHTLLRHLEHE
ncbi:MAG: tetratricopeptide repeat protein [Myxococcales bacterium]|nr:tetratricopeptide repeat protein [Myxococcales bacterium]